MTTRTIEVTRRGRAGVDGRIGYSSVAVITSSTALTNADSGRIYRTTGSITITLPSPVTSGWAVTVQVASGTVTLDTTALVNGVASVTVTAGTAVLVFSDGVNLFARPLGTFAAQADWDAGAGTYEATISPAKLRAAIKAALNASNSPPVYGVRAWANVDGATGTIRASGNVTSVTRTATGEYTVALTTAMPDTAYLVTGMAQRNLAFGSTDADLTVGLRQDASGTLMTASEFRLTCRISDTKVLADPRVLSFSVVR